MIESTVQVNSIYASARCMSLPIFKSSSGMCDNLSAEPGRETELPA